MKKETENILIAGGAIIAVGALAFFAGVIFASRKPTRLVVTENGELVKQEIEYREVGSNDL